ncbi:hypothetical protein WEI85_03505 [Actinomycetes bacterium KLBMP 9797]
MPDTHTSLPDFTRWPSFPFEGDLRVKRLDDPVEKEPPRKGEDSVDCSACHAPDDAYIWVSERWRVRAMDRPTGLPMVLILESRSHLDLGDLPNLLAAELGVMTVRLERAIRSLDGVARVHVNRWGDGSAHLHMWFLARPHGRLQLRGTFLSLWDDILPPIPEPQWRENLALVAAWLAEFGGKPLAAPPRIEWHAPSTLAEAADREASSARRHLDAATAESTAEATVTGPVVELANVEPAAQADTGPSEPSAGSSDRPTTTNTSDRSAGAGSAAGSGSAVGSGTESGSAAESASAGSGGRTAGAGPAIPAARSGDKPDAAVDAERAPEPAAGTARSA